MMKKTDGSCLNYSRYHKSLDINMFFRKILYIMFSLLSIILVHANSENSITTNNPRETPKTNEPFQEKGNKTEIFIAEGTNITNIHDVKGNVSIVHEKKKEKTAKKKRIHRKNEAEVKISRVVQSNKYKTKEDKQFSTEIPKSEIFFSLTNIKNLALSLTSFAKAIVNKGQSQPIFVKFYRRNNHRYRKYFVSKKHFHHLFTRPPPFLV